MELRICGVEDAGAVQRVAEATYRETFGPVNTADNLEAYVHECLSEARLAVELGCGDSIFVLAEDAGGPAGYLKMNLGAAQTELQDEKALEIERIYVLARAQGTGLGQRFMDFALDEARRRGLGWVWLGVWEHNERALRFYEKNGFARFGQHIYRLGADEQLDYMLRRDV